MRTMLMVLMVVVLKMLVVRWPNHEAKDNDQDDDQENEASVIRQAGAPLAHLEGNHRTKTCSLHAIFFKQLPLLFCIFK